MLKTRKKKWFEHVQTYTTTFFFSNFENIHVSYNDSINKKCGFFYFLFEYFDITKLMSARMITMQIQLKWL